MFLRIFAISLVVYQVTADCSDVNDISNTWQNGENAAFSFEVPETTNGWKVTVTFDKDVSNLQVYNGKKVKCDGNVCTFKNKGWNKAQDEGDHLYLGYQTTFDSLPAPIVTSLMFNDHELCDGGETEDSTTTDSGVTTEPTTTTTLDPDTADCSGVNDISSSWDTGMGGTFSFNVPETTNGWKMKVTFDKDVSQLQVWNGKKVECDGNVCTFKNKGWNKAQDEGDELNLGYQVNFDSLPAPRVTSLKFKGHELCVEAGATTTTTTTTNEPGLPSSCESGPAFEFTGAPWDSGANGKFNIEFPEDVDEWKVEVTFSSPVTDFMVWKGKDIECEGSTCTFVNQDWNGNQQAGTKLDIEFMMHFEELPDIIGLKLNGDDVCAAEPEPTTTTIAPTTTTNEATTTNEPTTTTNEPTTTTNEPSTTTNEPTTTTDGVTTSVGETDCQSNMDVNNAWDVGATGSFNVPIPMDVESWTVSLTFSSPVDLTVWAGTNINCNDKVCTFENQNYNGLQSGGTELKVDFQLGFESLPELVGMTVNGIDVCTGGGSGGGGDTTTSEPETTTNGPTTTESPITGPTTTTSGEPTTTGDSTTEPPTSDECVRDLYGFADAIDKSLLFYEAQRSGPLPDDMRITWRRDSGLTDGDDVGEDLTGGYYDAGDYVKFGFPMAGAMTILSWGGISYPQGYEDAGMMEYLRDAVKWGTDYFIKGHTAENEFYGQVGNGVFDHSSWGTPDADSEKMGWRPSYKIDANNPGSELAAETAASLASASILFQGADDDYSSELLEHAKQLYDFADQYRGKYSDSIADAATFYNSFGGYNDELVWGAIWLYKATGEQEYLDKAVSYYDQFGFGGKTQFFSWDDKLAGAQVLLAQETGDDRFLNDALNICQYYVDYQRSPGGRTHYLQWGSLRYAANAAFICLQASDLAGNEEQSKNFREYALGQMEYMLGSTGRSFVVGFGNNPPTQPHHASSSCPIDPNESCGWNNYNADSPNPHILYGALVGGPGGLNDDTLNDKRSDYIENEVTLDYNAGFQSLLAGLLQKAC